MTEQEFNYLETEKLPLLYQIKLMGNRWKAARCPYCGGRLIPISQPILHKHCLGECARNYV